MTAEMGSGGAQAGAVAGAAAGQGVDSRAAGGGVTGPVGAKFGRGQLVRVTSRYSRYSGMSGAIAGGPVERDGRPHWRVDLGGLRLLFGESELEGVS